jgi:hypothetical protein
MMNLKSAWIRPILCFSAFSISQISCGQTCIIAIGTKNEIVIGADSKALALYGKPHMMCKLGISDSVVFGFSGYIFPGKKDTAIGLLSSKQQTVNAKIIVLSKGLMPLINKYCEQIRVDSIAVYLKTFHKDSVMSAILICTFENGMPIISTLFFKPDNTPDEPFFAHPYLRSEAPFTKDHPFTYGIIGELQCFEELGRDSLEKIIRRKDKVKTIRHFINRQSKITPDHVSGPINLIRILPSNLMKWVAKSKECD